MICEFGDVVVVPFPFVDLPIAKPRPALVISGKVFNFDCGQTVLAMITTGAGSTWPSDIAITDVAEAGLRHASIVRFKLFTLPNALISRRVGGLSNSDRDTVRSAISSYLASQGPQSPPAL